jgi:CubicO group peptidase (beta-lactamase class C family)
MQFNLGGFMNRSMAVFLFAAFLAIILSCGSGQQVPVEKGAIELVENGLLSGAPVVGRPGASLEERMASLGVPAVSIAVIQDYEIVWAKAFGIADRSTGRMADTKTLFQAASISKPVTAMAVHRLVERGTLDLDTPVNEYLESWKVPGNELTSATSVTLRMLLSHTGGTTVSGFPGYEPGVALPSLQQVLDGESPANTPPIRVDIPPGETSRYSGGGTTIVQQMLIDVVGKPFPELMREMVLGPAGMMDSAFDQPLSPDRVENAAKAHRDGEASSGNSHIYPELAAAGLWTTPTDLARFAIAIQRSVRGDEDALIAQSTAEHMLTPVQGDAALGLFRLRKRGETYFGHGGGNFGFRCQLIFHPDKGYGAVVMTNASRGEVVADEVLNAIAHVYGWQGYLPEPIQPIEIGADELDTSTGRYRAGPNQVVVLTSGDGFLLHRGVLRPGVIPLYPVAPNIFRYPERYDDAFTFVRGQDGQIERIESESAGITWTSLADDELLAPELLLAGRIDEAIALYREMDVKEQRLNQVGYELLAEPDRVDEAISVFRLNTELFPDSSNTWDSLGEGYMTAGRTELAIANFEKSLKLDPANENAVAMLERLRAE